MSRFSSNLPPPLSFRFSRGPAAALGGQPLVPSPVLVPTSIIVVTSQSDGVGSLAPVPSRGHSVNVDVVPPAALLESAPRMDKRK